MKWIVFVLSFFSVHFLSAQVAPRLDWAKAIGKSSPTGGDVGVVDIAFDASGNRYVAGSFEGQADVDPGPARVNLQSNGANDMFFAKFDVSGNLIWAKGIGGIGGDFLNSIAIDASGNIIITGVFSNSVDFDAGAGATSLSSSGDIDIFFAKYDPSGNFLWAKQLGGIGEDNSFSVGLDAAGNIYLTGVYSAEVDFDPGSDTVNLVSASSPTSIFLAKYTASGDYVWAKGISTSGTVGGNGVSLALDASNNVYVTGSFDGTADFDAGSGTSNLVSGSSGNNVFFMKYDSAGDFIWAKSIHSIGAYDFAQGLTVDASGNIVLIGTFSGIADFDPSGGTAYITAFDDYTATTFMAKYSTSGSLIWAKSLEGNDAGSQSYPRSVKLDNLGNIYFSGAFNGTIDFHTGAGNTNTTVLASSWAGYLAKYTNAGNLSWVNVIDGYHSLGVSGLATELDASGKLWLGGYFQGDPDFDPDVDSVFLNREEGPQIQHGFVASYDANGDYLSAQILGSYGAGASVFILSTAQDATGNIYSTGRFEGSIDFDPGADSTILTSLSSENIFLTKFNALGNFVWAKVINGTGRGSGTSVAVDATGQIVLTGYFEDSLDFDPGAGSSMLHSSGYEDIFISKYDADGNYLWAKRMGGTEIEKSLSMVLDGTGNIVLTGFFGGTADFDPGVGIANLTSGGGTYNNIFLAKYDISGNYIWANVFTGSSTNDKGRTLAVDAAGNIYVSGEFWQTADFDPGPGTRNLTTSGYGSDLFLAKYKSNGQYAWAFNASSGSDIAGLSVQVDTAGYVMLAGTFSGTADFDPGPGTANLSDLSGFTPSGFLARYDTSGNYQWAKSILGDQPLEISGIRLDGTGNAIVAGHFNGTADFDPGPDQTIYSSVGENDIFLAKYDTAGNYIWSQQVGGVGYDLFDNPHDKILLLDAVGDIILTGQFQETVDFDPGAGSTTINAGTSQYFSFIAKYLDSTTTIAVPNEPTGLSATAGYNAAHISFTAPTNNGGGAIINYEYKLNDSAWVALSPAKTGSALTISGLTACDTYTIRIRAVNAAGGGTASDSVVVQPQGGEPAGINWVARTASSSKAWFSVTYGDGKFVALADASSNMVMTSPDGITWTGQTASADYGWSSITYGNGMYVAVATSGTNRVLTSQDGVTWILGVSAEQNNWNAITYGNGLFVAVASSGTNRVMTSPDGITWTARSASAPSSWYSVTYGNGLFVAVAHSGTDRVMTSPDGINWTSRTAAEANFWRYVTYGNGLFVAVSSDGTNRVMTSPDGINWTARSASQALAWMSVTYGNGMFVAVASQSNQVMTSTDGFTWTSRTVPEANRWTSVIYGNGKFVAVAYMGPGTNRVMTSSELLTPGSPVISGITPGATTASVAFTAPASAGSSAITNYEYSVDNGSSWVTPSPADTTSPLTITGLTGGTSYAVKLRAVNTQGAGCATAVDSVTTVLPANAPTGLVATAGYNAAHIAFTAPTNNGGSAIINYEYKLNESSWMALSPAKTGSALTISGLTACNTYTIRIRAVNAAGGGTASDSVVVTPLGGQSAGISWTTHATVEDYPWTGVTYANGVYVAVTSNKTMTSTDGVNWTTTVAVPVGNWWSVTYGNGIFVSVANNGTNRVMTSPDGVTWTARAPAETNAWRSVTYGNGIFVAVANSGTNRVMTSPDGITWTARAAAESTGWNSVTYGNGLFVAVAGSGTNRVMTSPDGITWTSRSASEQNIWPFVTYGNGLFVAVAGNGTNRVMTSPDGITWTARSAVEAVYWNSVTFGNGLFVAVSGGGTNRVMTSPDGITWTGRSAPSGPWTRITYGNGKFVALANEGTNVMTSSDLLTPGSPVISGITPGGTTASVAFTAPANAGSSAITNYEYSVDNGSNWVTPSPADTTSPLSITGLTGGTSYAVKLRAVNTQGAGCATAVDSVTTSCINPTNGGTIAAAQSGAAPFNPAAFTSTTDASGASGTLEYKWQSSTTDSSSGFSDIASSNSATYDPGALSQTTWFKRLARVSCQADWTGAVQSNVLKVTVSKAWIGGNGNWNVGANWSDGLVPVTSDLLTISSGNPQLNVDYEIGGSLTISGTGSLTVNAGKTLTVSGTADFGGKSVVFRSNASATAQLGVVSGTLINDDNVTVERFIPNTGRRWRLLTAPVDGVSINQAWQNGQTWNGTAALTGDTTGTLITGKQQGNATSANNRGFDYWSAISNSSSSLQTYSQRAGQGTWIELGNTLSSNAFNSNQGYLVFVRGPRSSAYSTGTSNASTTLRPTGKLRQGTISIRVDGSKGFTVVGNPYASQIDFDAVYSNSGNSALIKRQIWVWDATRGASGDFQAVMYSEGKYIEVPAKFHSSGQASPLTAIQSGQAFMVVPQSASSGNMTIRESNKISTMPSTPNLLLGSDKTPRIYLNLMRRESTGEATLSDGIMVSYRSGYRMETTDEDDMLKFNNLGDNMVVMNNGTGLIADARPLKEIGSPIALNMWNLSGSAYRFEVKMEGMAGAEWEAYLEDKELMTRSVLSMQGDITSVDWQMLTNGSTATSERFRIVFERKAVRVAPTPEGMEEAQSIRVYPNPVTGRQFTVRLSQLPSDVYTLQLYSIDGRMVMNKRIKHESGTGQYKLDLEASLPKGTYQLHCLKGKEPVSITKLVIQ
jgi:hypothetical protein